MILREINILIFYIFHKLNLNFIKIRIKKNLIYFSFNILVILKIVSGSSKWIEIWNWRLKVVVTHIESIETLVRLKPIKIRILYIRSKAIEIIEPSEIWCNIVNPWLEIPCIDVESQYPGIHEWLAGDL